MSLPTITDDRQMLIKFVDERPDGQGRRHFFAYWLADNVGPHLDQVGTRGQSFHMDPAAFTAREQARGWRVATTHTLVPTSDPDELYNRERCARLGHPQGVYNQHLDQTFCRCGGRRTAGDHASLPVCLRKSVSDQASRFGPI